MKLIKYILRIIEAKKASAFWVVFLITICHVKWLNAELVTKEDFSLLPYVIAIDYCFVVLALGLGTFEQVLKLKTGDK